MVLVEVGEEGPIDYIRLVLFWLLNMGEVQALPPLEMKGVLEVSGECFGPA